ncbi:hypothetical protein Xen7305DRAFT_00036710 [Xenococcus sp. PCC 7305]|uniref:DUF4359 domain-containing protein n=1 Tax=Xenococcus sp. PCC 7305 TaxID=102125 RepID=UPI0002AB9DBE|nr:DUF4359 domain-containing protein [Xenococcus sp. PCC 7305]ELS03947.1 hypothetical protein Xen7305DRAFT_00036710 [Xenococcus sp. PCC 7305]
MSKINQGICKLGLIFSGSILTITNPGPGNYEQYASEQLNTYLKQDVCPEIDQKLSKPCSILVDFARPQLNMAIADQTQRRNFLLFSIYQTELSIPSTLPDYYFETLGIFDKFYTYCAESSD